MATSQSHSESASSAVSTVSPSTMQVVIARKPVIEDISLVQNDQKHHDRCPDILPPPDRLDSELTYEDFARSRDGPAADTPESFKDPSNLVKTGQEDLQAPIIALSCEAQHPELDAAAGRHAPVQPSDAQDEQQEESDASPHLHRTIDTNETLHHLSLEVIAAGTVSSGLREQSARLWLSPWLANSVLYAFLGIWILFLGASITLYETSRRYNGISTQLTSNHYAWTYGPTALLVLVLSLWSQVDYSLRIIAPWNHMWLKPSTAARSFLLDYVSPIFPIVTYRAIKQQDWAVAASTSSLPLMRMIIIFSTGLLVLSPTLVKDNNATVLINSKFTAEQHLHQVPDIPALEYYSINGQGAELPFGTTNELAFDTINVRSLAGNSTVTAAVNAFIPEISCEFADVQSHSVYWSQYLTLQLSVNLTTSSCPPIYNFALLVDGLAPQNVCPRAVLGYLVTSPLSPNPSNTDTVSDGPCGNQILFSITDVDCGKLSPSNHTISELNTVLELKRYSMLVCRPYYSYEEVDLTVDLARFSTGRGIQINRKSNGSGMSIEGFSNANLTNYLLSTMRTTSTPDQVEVSAKAEEGHIGHIFDIFVGFMSLHNSYSPIGAFFDTEVFEESVKSVYSGVAALIAGQTMRHHDLQATTGVLIQEEDRLQVRLLSTIFMVAGFFILIAINSLIILSKPKPVVIRDPGCLMTQALILAHSSNLQQALHLKGHLEEKSFEKKFWSCNFLTRVAPSGFVLETTFNIQMPSEPEDEHQITWWRPFAIRRMAVFLSLALPLAFIIVLEILQRLSDKNQGLSTVISGSSTRYSVPALVSALVLMLISMLYDSIYFALNTFSLYEKLGRGPSSVQYLLQNTVGKHLFKVLVIAVRVKEYPLALGTIAASLASVLTVIISGLFTLETVPISQNMSLVALDQFNTTWNATLGDNGATVNFDIIEWANGTYLPFTYDEFAFPRVKMISESANMMSTNGSAQVPLKASLPAMRANLDCSIVPRYDVNVNDTIFLSDADSYWSFNVSAIAQSPKGCRWYVPSQYWIEHEIEFWTQVLGIYPYQDIYYGKVFYIDPFHVNPPHCPSFAFFAGHFEYNNTDPANVTFFTCTQNLEKLLVEINFFAPGMTINTDKPPQAVEGSTSEVIPTNYDMASIIWADWDDFDGLSFWPATRPDEKTVIVDWSHMFGALIGGINGIPASELVGPANQDRLVNATNHLYRRYMAQAINSNMRRSLSPAEISDQSNQFPAQFQLSSVLRLKVNQTSKIILQIVLGVMCLLEIIVFISTDMRHTLPHSPYTIAGVMSVLAGSEFCDETGAGGILGRVSQYSSDKEIEKELHGWTISLGWWNTANGEGQGGKRFGIGLGQAEKARKDQIDHVGKILWWKGRRGSRNASRANDGDEIPTPSSPNPAAVELEEGTIPLPPRLAVSGCRDIGVDERLPHETTCP